MLKCLIFDFDGVVINSIEVQKHAYYESCRQVLGNNAKIPSFDEYLKHTGDSLSNIFKKLSLPNSLVELYRCISREAIDKIVIIDELIEYLRILKSKGIVMALCTGKDRIRTLEILEYYRIDDVFECIVCSDDVKCPKPDKESLIKICDELKLEASECIMVGDGSNDILCAENAHMKSILTKWCDGKAQDCKPTYEVEKVEDFILLVNGLLDR